MSDCPANTYFSAFVNSCVSCPDGIGNCGKESAADSLSCERSCADKLLPPVSEGNFNAVVIGSVLGFLALIVVGIILYYKYLRPRINKSGAGTSEGNPDPGYSLQEELRTGSVEIEGGNDDTASSNEVVFTTENELLENDRVSTSLDKSQGSSQPFLYHSN